MAVTPEHSTSRQREHAGGARPTLLRPALLAVLSAAAAAAVVHLLFAAAGADYVVEPPGQPRSTVLLAQSVGVAALAALIGAGITVLAARRSRRPERIVVGLAVVGLLLFAANPFLAAEQTLTIVALEVMHLAVAGAFLAVLLPALRRTRG